MDNEEDNEDLYDRDVMEEALDNDEISDDEEGFMTGYIDC